MPDLDGLSETQEFNGQPTGDAAEPAVDLTEGAPVDEASVRAAIARRKANRSVGRAEGTPPKGPDGKFQKRAEQPAEAAPAPAAPKPKPKVVEAPKVEAKPEAPKPDAPKDGPVAVAERVAFREEQRLAKAKLEREYAERNAKIQAAVSALEQRAAKFLPLVEAAEKGEDISDAFAKLIGHPDANAWQRDRAKRAASPEYQEIQRLKAAQAKRDAEEAAAKTKAEQESQKAQQARAEHEHLQGIGRTLAESEDPVDKAVAEKPWLARAILEVQRRAWHSGERVLSPAEALREKEGEASLLDKLRADWQYLGRIFGNESPASPPQAGVPSGKAAGEPIVEKKPATPTLSRGAVTDATGSRKRSREERIKHFSRLMADSDP